MAPMRMSQTLRSSLVVPPMASLTRAALLPQIFEGGNLKTLGLLPLSLQQGALCSLHLEVFTLFRGRTLRGCDFYALRAVSRPL